MGMLWGEYEQNQCLWGVMCADAPVSVFHMVAAGLESEEERSGATWRAEGQRESTMATPAVCWGVSSGLMA